ncbi:hypothetical protein RPHASCH2410_CH18630 [Rhizobium phaseoli Ch24-10]|nr:hypothetical protein RPHASCH2410_CH18630 [Rhizobium phaseoli Ch24-10]
MLSCNWPVPISQVSIEETATGRCHAGKAPSRP